MTSKCVGCGDDTIETKLCILCQKQKCDPGDFIRKKRKQRPTLTLKAAVTPKKKQASMVAPTPPQRQPRRYFCLKCDHSTTNANRICRECTDVVDDSVRVYRNPAACLRYSRIHKLMPPSSWAGVAWRVVTCYRLRQTFQWCCPDPDNVTRCLQCEENFKQGVYTERKEIRLSLLDFNNEANWLVSRWT